MKKLLIISLCLVCLCGCSNENSDFCLIEKTICREGNKIWVARRLGGGLTSEIIGTCEQGE